MEFGLGQTGWAGPPFSEDNWRLIVHQHLQKLDWEGTLNDLIPFLEPGFDVLLLTKDNLEDLLIGSAG